MIALVVEEGCGFGVHVASAVERGPNNAALIETASLFFCLDQDVIDEVW